MIVAKIKNTYRNKTAHRLKAVAALIVAMLVLAACVPAVPAAQKNPDLGSGKFATQAYNLMANGEPVQAEDGVWIVEHPAFLLTVNLRDTSFFISITNRTEGNLVVDPNESAATVSGLASRLLPGGASWATRNDVQPRLIVLKEGVAFETFFPLRYVSFSSGLKFSPMFTEESQPSSIKLSLAVEFDGEKGYIELDFSKK